MAGAMTASAAMTAFAATVVSDVMTASAVIVAGMTAVGMADEMAVIMDEAGAARGAVGIGS
ncbi:hypothetical protein IV03_17120 [Pseudomonas congelans]|nr:hypothetical protein IV03_17120 [Pseudomonas congelans]